MPTIKSLTFRAGGHHATCAMRRRYLEGASRHIDRAFLNITEPERWDKEMDLTRETYSLRGCVAYREFILSPGEEDGATVGQVRQMAVEWAQANFPTAEVAIVLHDDNRERIENGLAGIVHAHVVVNSVDLETGKKIVLSNSTVRELHNSLQDIAEGLGLSTVADYEPGKRLESSQERARTRTERQMHMRGKDSWKEAVRDMALQALSASLTTDQFATSLWEADIDIYVKRGRIYLADRDNPDMACRADRLDKALSAEAIAEHFAAANPGRYEGAESLVRTIKDELTAGAQIHAERIEYDRMFSERIAKYKHESKVKADELTPSTMKSLLPEPTTPAQIERMREFANACRNAQKRIEMEILQEETARRRRAERMEAAQSSRSQDHSEPQRSAPSRGRAR